MLQSRYEVQILYGITDTSHQGLGFSLCLIIAKYYINIASKSDEDYLLDAFWLSLVINY